MKHTFWKILLCLLLITSIIPTVSLADNDLDEIERYEITVNVRQDGTLDIKYEITWKVLSDKNGKEPLTWVLVGIPNEHVDQIQALTDNIKTAVYSHDRGGDFVRIDFSEDHYQDEVITFSFAIHQSYMYMLDEEDVCRYSFTPGWFEKIEIKELHMGQKYKVPALEAIMKKYNLDFSQVAYMGDDLPDICVLERVGLKCCPDDAGDEVKKVCNYIASKGGGKGAVRELCDFILEAKNITYSDVAHPHQQ